MTRKLGDYLRNIRLKEGGKKYWSLSAVAKRAGVSHSFLSQVERNKYMASPEFLKKIAPALQVPIEELYRRAGFLPLTRDKKKLEIENILADKEFMNFYKKYNNLTTRGKELLGEYGDYLRKKNSSKRK